VPIWEKKNRKTQFWIQQVNGLWNDRCMAEAKRDLIWIQTAFFMGWGCDACSWRDLIPRDIPTLVAPSAEGRQAFKQHKCDGMPPNRKQLNLTGQRHSVLLHKF